MYFSGIAAGSGLGAVVALPTGGGTLILGGAAVVSGAVVISANTWFIVNSLMFAETLGSGNSGSSEDTNKDVPQKVFDVVSDIKQNNGAPLKGYKGGRTFKNDGRGGGQVLPGDTTYREYDVNPYVKGQNRGAERVVVGNNGSVWYTNDHYKTFTQIE